MRITNIKRFKCCKNKNQKDRKGKALTISISQKSVPRQLIVISLTWSRKNTHLNYFHYCSLQYPQPAGDDGVLTVYTGDNAEELSYTSYTPAALK